MSVVFPADRQIAGYKPTVLKKALLAYSRTENSTNLLGLKMFPEKRDAAIMYEEWLDRGLIGADGNLTDKGKAIAAGKARKRVSCAEAQAILDDFLNRVDAVNRDRDHIVNVQQVWLYGSMLKEGVTAVADIDLAVLSSRRDEYHATLNAKDGGAKAKEQLRKLLARHPDHPSTGSFSTSMCPWWFGAEVWLVRRALYGARRHPLLSIHEGAGTHELAATASPCQLLYDWSRGGLVNDPVLPHHPASDGTPAETLRTHYTDIPDLTPAKLSPMDARWLANYAEHGLVDNHTLERIDLFVVGDKGADLKRWTPQRVKTGDLNYRDAVALVGETLPPFDPSLLFSKDGDRRPPLAGVSVVLRRHIEITNEGWTLQVWFEDLEVFRNRKRINDGLLYRLADAAAKIVSADLERMRRRTAEEPGKWPMVTIKVCPQAVGPLSDIRRWFEQLLTTSAGDNAPLGAAR